MSVDITSYKLQKSKKTRHSEAKRGHKRRKSEIKMKVPKLNFKGLPNFLKQEQKTNIYLEKYKNMVEKDKNCCYPDDEIFV